MKLHGLSFTHRNFRPGAQPFSQTPSSVLHGPSLHHRPWTAAQHLRAEGPGPENHGLATPKAHSPHPEKRSIKSPKAPSPSGSSGPGASPPPPVPRRQSAPLPCPSSCANSDSQNRAVRPTYLPSCNTCVGLVAPEQLENVHGRSYSVTEIDHLEPAKITYAITHHILILTVSIIAICRIPVQHQRLPNGAFSSFGPDWTPCAESTSRRVLRTESG